MPLIYFWRKNIYDADVPYIEETGLALQQNSAAFGSLRRGERVWAFTRNDAGTYVLAGQVVVRRMHEDPDAYYGRYVLDPVPGSTVLYELDESPSIEPLLRTFSIAPTARVLGQSFQGPAAARRITPEEDARLAQFAESLNPLGSSDGAGSPERASDTDEPDPPLRKAVTTLRIIRDSVISRHLKQQYADACQICGTVVHGDGNWSYSEAHHIRPLGGTHGGRDETGNILILCPNHHALCDFGAVKLEVAALTVHRDHKLKTSNIVYHNTRIYRH